MALAKRNHLAKYGVGHGVGRQSVWNPSQVAPETKWSGPKWGTEILAGLDPSVY